MRAAICHGRKKNNRPFTISIPNTNHIHNAKVRVSLFKGTSLRTRDQHFWCRRAERVFDNEMLNANRDHVLSQEERLDLRTKRKRRIQIWLQPTLICFGQSSCSIFLIAALLMGSMPTKTCLV